MPRASDDYRAAREGHGSTSRPIRAGEPQGVPVLCVVETRPARPLADPDPFGGSLTRAVTRCIDCGVGPRSYPGRRCGGCWRASNGIVLAPPVAPPPAPSPVLVVLKEVAPAAARAPVARAPSKRCQWAGCDRKHARYGACQRDSRRLVSMGAVGTDPDTWPSAWEVYQRELDDLAAWNGQVHRGLGRAESRPMLTLKEWRVLRRKADV